MYKCVANGLEGDVGKSLTIDGKLKSYKYTKFKSKSRLTYLLRNKSIKWKWILTKCSTQKFKSQKESLTSKKPQTKQRFGSRREAKGSISRK